MRHLKTGGMAIVMIGFLVIHGIASADIGVERTPAGDAGMERLNRGLDSRTRQQQRLSDQLERQRQRLDSRSEARRNGAAARTDRARPDRRDFDTDPLD